MTQKKPNSPGKPQKTNGFILLEALLAMSLIAGVWIAMTHTYQALVLRLVQHQEKQEHLKKELDEHEIAQHRFAREQFSPKPITNNAVIHEPSRMPRRNRPEFSARSPFVKK